MNLSGESRVGRLSCRFEQPKSDKQMFGECMERCLKYWNIIWISIDLSWSHLIFSFLLFILSYDPITLSHPISLPKAGDKQKKTQADECQGHGQGRHVLSGSILRTSTRDICSNKNTSRKVLIKGRFIYIFLYNVRGGFQSQKPKRCISWSPSECISMTSMTSIWIQIHISQWFFHQVKAHI